MTSVRPDASWSGSLGGSEMKLMPIRAMIDAASRAWASSMRIQLSDRAGVSTSVARSMSGPASVVMRRRRSGLMSPVSRARTSGSFWLDRRNPLIPSFSAVSICPGWRMIESRISPAKVSDSWSAYAWASP